MGGGGSLLNLSTHPKVGDNISRDFATQLAGMSLDTDWSDMGLLHGRLL